MSSSRAETLPDIGFEGLVSRREKGLSVSFTEPAETFWRMASVGPEG